MWRWRLRPLEAPCSHGRLHQTLGDTRLLDDERHLEGHHHRDGLAVFGARRELVLRRRVERLLIETVGRVKGSGHTSVAERPVGSDHTGYVLKLRDNATGKEVYAGAFGRRKVQQACESQGWSFS